MSTDEEMKKLMDTMSPELRAQLLGANVDPKVFDIFAETLKNASETTLSLGAMAYAATGDPAMHEKIIRSCAYTVTLHHALAAVMEAMIPEPARCDLYKEIIGAIEEILPKTDEVFRVAIPATVAEARARQENPITIVKINDEEAKKL